MDALSPLMTRAPLDWQAPAAGASPERIRESAQQFEALLIGQVLQSMRASGGGWLGTGDDQAGATMAEYAEQHVAQLLASQGGFGLASLVVAGFERAGPAPPAQKE